MSGMFHGWMVAGHLMMELAKELRGELCVQTLSAQTGEFSNCKIYHLNGLIDQINYLKVCA